VLLHEPFDFHAHTRGDNCFVLCDGVSYSYREALDRSMALTRALRAAELSTGDRIVLLQRNSIDGLLLIFAASRIGAVVIPLNYRLSPREWVDLTVDASPRLIFADPDFASRLDAAAADRPLPSDIARVSLAEDVPGWASLATFLIQGDPSIMIAAPTDSAIVVQMYTSGTTGRPKGAMLSQRALMTNAIKLNFAAPYRLNPGERFLIVLPLFHIATLATTLAAIVTGACLVIHREVDTAAIFRSLREDGIVAVTLVPSVIQFLLAEMPAVEAADFPKLRYVCYGASPIAAPVVRKALGMFKCAMAQGYGMTEMSGAITLLTEDDHRRAIDTEPDLLLSAGRALPGTDVRVVSREGESVAPGEIGEILIRGDDLFTAYWQQPDATAAAFDNGWFHTGDAGCLDARGYLYIRDRVKDMIITGAENVYPIEVESVLIEHPAIRDAAVIGIPDERWGEAVLAVVVVEPGEEVDAAALDRFCRQRLGGFKVPKRYEFRSDLPRNAAGKVLKKDLRQDYWHDAERAIG
jgi:fatty-acyl-CoA synthase